MDILPPLPVAIPLFVAPLLVVLEKMPGRRRLLDLLATASALAVFVIDLLLFEQSLGGTLVYWFGGWQPWRGFPVGIAFVVDPVSALLASLAAFLAGMALIYSWHYFKAIGIYYHTLMLLFLAAMEGFSLTGDLFNMFVFFELMGVTAYALTGYKTEDTGPLEGALNFAVMNSIAAFLLLFGIGIVYARTGGLNMAWAGAAIAAQPLDAALQAAFVLLVIGFLIKSAILPFHFWLPDAHAVAPTPASMLFSGIMVELGLYGIARIYWTMFSVSLSAEQVRTLLIGIGLATALAGGVMALIQRHLKRLLAFSTVSHSGFMLAGIGMIDPGAMAGTLVYLLGHGCIKASLFASSGIILFHYGSVDTEDIRGRGRHIRAVAVLYFITVAALAGVPPFATFTGKSAVEHAADGQGLGWLTAFILATSTLTAAAAARAGGAIFFNWGGADILSVSAPSSRKEAAEATGKFRRTPAAAWLSLVLCLAAGLAIGLLPQMGPLSRQAADRFCNQTLYCQTVLGPALPPRPVAMQATPASYLNGLVAGGLTVVLAGALLYSNRLPAGFIKGLKKVITPALKLLHGLHSGYIGDYVTWFMVGSAAILLLVLATQH